MRPLTLAGAQGAYTLVNGLWPLVGMHSLEAVLGPGLLVTNGIAMLRTESSADGIRQAKRIGIAPRRRSLRSS